MTLPEIFVIIPAFNEEKTIGKVVAGVKSFVKNIIVVNDGSSDNTGAEAGEAGAIVVTHKKNQGYDIAVEDGFKEAIKRGADVLVTFDADGQHNPEDVKRLTNLLINGQADVVVSERQKLTHFSEKIFAWYTNYFFGIKDPLCGLKAYSKKVYESIGHFDTIQSIGTQLMIEALRQGFKVKIIPIIVNKRRDSSRFYFHNLKANYKILKALIKIIVLKNNLWKS